MKSAHLLLAAVAVCLALLPAAATAKSLSYNDVRGTPFTVAYDHRAFTINGERQLIQSGSIHSPRSTPDMWRRLMRLAAENGLNAIETYTFWNIRTFCVSLRF